MSGYPFRVENRYPEARRDSSSSITRRIMTTTTSNYINTTSPSIYTDKPSYLATTSLHTKYSSHARERTPEKYPALSTWNYDTPSRLPLASRLKLQELDTSLGQTTASARRPSLTSKGIDTPIHGIPAYPLAATHISSPGQAPISARRLSYSMSEQAVGAFSPSAQVREHRESSASRAAGLLEALPPTFDHLKKEGFDIQHIDNEQKINSELLRVGRGLLDMIKAVHVGIEAAKTANTVEAIKHVIPSLDSRLNCTKERLDDTKRRLRDSHKVDLADKPPVTN